MYSRRLALAFTYYSLEIPLLISIYWVNDGHFSKTWDGVYNVTYVSILTAYFVYDTLNNDPITKKNLQFYAGLILGAFIGQVISIAFAQKANPDRQLLEENVFSLMLTTISIMIQLIAEYSDCSRRLS